jgi:hypothetical protein
MVHSTETQRRIRAGPYHAKGWKGGWRGEEEEEEVGAGVA